MGQEEEVEKRLLALLLKDPQLFLEII